MHEKSEVIVQVVKSCNYMYNTLAWDPNFKIPLSQSESMEFYSSEMTIFFGASSGNDLGKVTVKRPLSIVALICSTCTP